MRKILWLSAVLLSFYSCKPAKERQKHSSNYFDLKNYFEKEAARLKKSNPVVTKTVTLNGSWETRKMKIGDWQKEFTVFTDVDINRSAWAGLFEVQKSGGQELYTSTEEKIPVKEVLILKKGSKPYGVRILIKNSNMLYSSSDTLLYYPDSLYQVRKKQHIRLLSEKAYGITGKFN